MSGRRSVDLVVVGAAIAEGSLDFGQKLWVPLPSYQPDVPGLGSGGKR